jgi:glycosyltransferase involved in cell wall biosynthesis
MSDRDLRVFLAGTSFKSSYGGPAISVASLARALAFAGAEVGVWAPDRSTLCAWPQKEQGIQCLSGTVKEALDEFGPTDIIHDNGIWWPHNHAICRRASELKVPRLVSTRGMLEPWAIRHKAWKKRLAWQIFQKHDLRGAALHHATSEREADHLRRLALGVPIITIPNGIELPKQPELCRLQDGRPSRKGKTALFLGRLYPIKGLPMLVEAWARVRPGGWNLVIAGPDESGHRAEIERVVRRHGLTQQVSLAGPVAPQDRMSVYASTDLFILPSYSESFGMSVGEALACGLPVITTTGTPWSQLVERGCGWRVAPTVEGLAGALRDAMSSDAATLTAMGEKGKAYVAAEFAWSAIARRMIVAYRSIAVGAADVDSVAVGV